MATEQLQESPPRPETSFSRKPEDAPSSENNAQGRRRTLLFAAVLGSVILIGAIWFLLYSGTYESTDDAQVDGHLDGLTSRIDGEIKAVYAEENQSVQAGQLLVELDPRDYQVALEQAQAQLAEGAGRRAR